MKCGGAELNTSAIIVETGMLDVGADQRNQYTVKRIARPESFGFYQENPGAPAAPVTLHYFDEASRGLILVLD